MNIQPYNKNSKCSDDSHSSAKIVLVRSLKYTPVTQSILCLIFFNVCSNHAPLNHSGQGSKNNLQILILIYLTLKGHQGHQSCNELLDPEQGYNHTKFERPPVNSVCQRANIKVLVISENMSMTSLEYVQSEKQWYIHHLLDLSNNPTKFKVIG